MEDEITPALFQKGDLDFIKANYPDIYKKIEPNILPDGLNVKIHSDKEWEDLQNWLAFGLGYPNSLNGIELNHTGLKLESIIDDLVYNN